MADSAREAAGARLPAVPVGNIPLAGKRVEIAASIDGIRAHLEVQRLAAFDAAVDQTPAKHFDRGRRCSPRADKQVSRPVRPPRTRKV
ncbi:hypothetical protein ACIP88_17325 [Streptomyces uncialis]|uniref:hypothetical protein n=1 Tax=Streptomyces uncialis TaxID=1048205 RepID=UPI003827D8EF